MDGIWDRVKQIVRLGGIVAIASASLALSACSSNRKVENDGQPPDLSAGPDAAQVDAGAPDAAGADAAQTDSKPPTPDARLWDVLCE